MAEWPENDKAKVKRQKEENRAKDFSPLPITRHPSPIIHSQLSTLNSLLSFFTNH